MRTSQSTDILMFNHAPYTWWSPNLPNPHWPYQQLVYTDAIIYLPCSRSEQIILPDSFSAPERSPVGWMWWERARRRQFIQRLYYYLHLRKQTAWKQIEGEREWQMRNIDSCIKWIKLIKKRPVQCIFHQRPSNRGLEDMYTEGNEFLPEDQRGENGRRGCGIPRWPPANFILSTLEKNVQYTQ